MAGERLRVILLTHGGSEMVLEELLAVASVEVVGVFVETEIVRGRERSFREKLARSVRYDGYAATAAKFLRKLAGGGSETDGYLAQVGASNERLSEIARAAGVPVHSVPDFHREDSIALLRAARADLGVVYGTNILKESVFGVPRLGSINLHQGLAPLYRGGPPVFWELFNGEREVGLTVHFVASKVDTGDIVLQETVPLEYDFDAHGLDFDSFITEFRASMMRRCAQLVAEAVRRISEGSAKTVKQDTTQGRRYRIPTKKEKDELRRRLRARRREWGAAKRSVETGRTDEASRA